MTIKLAEFRRMSKDEQLAAFAEDLAEKPEDAAQLLATVNKIMKADWITMNDEFAQAEIKATELMALAQTVSYDEFRALPPPDNLTLLTLIGFVSDGVKQKIKDARSEQTRKAANAKHKSHREKKEAIRTIWAEGNFLFRYLCADEEWKAEGFKNKRAAKEALKGTPDPNPWPAKEEELLRGKAVR